MTRNRSIGSGGSSAPIQGQPQPLLEAAVSELLDLHLAVVERPDSALWNEYIAVTIILATSRCRGRSCA
jgi:hypothetical protein